MGTTIITTKPTTIFHSTPPVNFLNTFYYFGGNYNLTGKAPKNYPYLYSTSVREIREDYDILSLDDVMCHPFSFQPITPKKTNLFNGFCFYVFSLCKNIFLKLT